MSSPSSLRKKNRPSILARSAWFRLMLVLPVCILFWLGVWWALAGTTGNMG